MEATNIHPGTIEQIYKIASVNLSPNTTGQVRSPRSAIPGLRPDVELRATWSHALPAWHG